MAVTKGKTFWARITAFPKPPGGGGPGEPDPTEPDDGGDDGENGENGGDGGAGIVPPIGEVPTPPGVGKPRGFRTVAFDEDAAPQGPPTPPGKWVVVDAGRGKPPAFGFMGSDYGLGGDGGEDGGEEGEEGDKPQLPTPNPLPGGVQRGGAPAGSAGKSGDGGDAGTKPSKPPMKGHWVAIQYPAKEPRSKDAEPTFVWLPQIGEHFGVKHKSGNGNGNGDEPSA